MSSKAEHTHLSQKEAARKLNMWAGSHETQEIQQLVIYDKHLKIDKIISCEALIKIIWEIISNALDQYIMSLDNDAYLPVKILEITFKDGVISVYNDGCGIPVEMRKTHDGREMYLPQMLFTEFHAGSNFDKKNSSAKNTGGMNGVGATLTNIWSSKFVIETQDEKNGLLYHQVCHDSIRKIDPPTIRKKKARRGWTRITFTPDYDRFKLKKDNKMYTMIDTVLRTTSYLSSAFIGKKVKFLYNGNPIPVGSADDLAGLLGKYETFPFTVDIPAGEDSKQAYTWTGSVVVHGGDEVPDISVINGIYSQDGGDHVKWVKNCIWEELKSRATKKLSKLSSANVKTSVINQISVVVCGLIENPQFRSQRKDYMTVKSKIMKGWTISPKNIYSKIWKPIEENIISTYYQTMTEDATTTTRVRSSIGRIDGYEDCTWAGKKGKSKDAILVACEGLSAISAFTKVKQSPKIPQLNHDNCAIYSLGGVITNVRKHGTWFEDKKSKKRTFVPNKKLLDSEWWNDFLKITNLNMKMSYTSQKNLDTLRIGRILILSDEDIDGVGKIAPLLMNLVMTFWPELGERGFIARFETPIIRAYLPKKPKEGLAYIPFYTPKECSQWEEKTANSKRYRIRYYKGLGGHTPKEIVEAFMDYQKHMYTLPSDKQTESRLELYFGKDTSVRKHELSSSKKYKLPAPEKGAIPMSSYLNTYVKEYQKDTLYRSLPDYRDGYTRTRRKIIHGLMAKFMKNGNSDMKVFQFGGFVASEMGFHHGDESLYKTIINLTKPYYSGGPLYPIPIGLGQFGSTRFSGDNTGSRYISIMANLELLKAMYPPEDMSLLPDNYIDGDKVEKQYFMPVVPPIIESYDLIATGWSVSTIPLRFTTVVENVRRAMKDEKLLPMERETWGYEKCRFFKGSGRQSVCVASYEVKGNTVVIDQLPPGMFTKNLEEKLTGKPTKKGDKKDEGKPLVISCRDLSKGPFEIRVEIEMVPGWEAKLVGEVKTKKYKQLTDLEVYLGIWEQRGNQVNFFDSVSGQVLENASYEDLFWLWFGERMALYETRVGRERIILEFKILIATMRLKYIKSGFNPRGLGLDGLYKYLVREKYPRIDTAFVNNPDPRVPNELIADEVAKGDHKYITRINEENRTSDGQKVYQEEIDRCKKRLDYINTPGQSFVGELVWKDDLARVEELVKKFREIRWEFDP